MKEYFKQSRNWYHVLIAFTLGYDLTFLFGFSNRENFPLSWEDFRTILAPIAATLLIGLGAFLWEKRQDKIVKNISDMRDVYVSMIAAYVGGVVVLFYPNLVVSIILTAISLVVFLKHHKE